MANSSIIASMKDKVIKEIINDEMIVKAINASYESPDDLINTHIFRFNQNPQTINQTITFITVQVSIPKSRDRNKTWIMPVLEIWIYSHNQHMNIRNIAGVSASRNDYLSELLDKKFNNRNDLGGYGNLQLESNVEGVFDQNFVYRRMIFETKDLNKKFCR